MTTLEFLSSIIAPLCGLAGVIISALNNRKISKVDTKVDDNTKLTTDNTVKTIALQKTVDVVKTQTDGMGHELAETKKLLGEAVGRALGKEEQKAETDAANLKASDIAVKVEVVNEPLTVVSPKDDKGK